MNPLVQDGKKLIPSVTRVFGTTREIYVYFQAYKYAVQSDPTAAKATYHRCLHLSAFILPVSKYSRRRRRRSCRTLPVWA